MELDNQTSHSLCAHCDSHHNLTVKALQVKYKNILALTEISFATLCGRSLALIGPNGAGKSTLLKAIAGLLPISSGTITWRGTKIRKWSREIAYLPQRDKVDWNFPITVKGVVSMGRFSHMRWWRAFSKNDEEHVMKSLEKMEIIDIANRQINELSGGQQQRIFIARALAQEAHVLLLDEPFNGLDAPAKDSLANLLKQLAQEGRLVMVSHHDLASVREIYDEALLINNKQIAFGEAKDVISDELLSKAYGKKINISMQKS